MVARIVGIPALKECQDTEQEEGSIIPVNHDFSFILNKEGVRFLPELSLKAGKLG